jgi:phosphate:Na+ symporter
MNFGILDFLQILGSLALFIYGMKIMSEGIQLAAGTQLRNILRGMTRNRYIGVATGFLITALVQSSSATTVMTVGFVNAGLLTLTESAGIMMGANIGTTVTGWLISQIGIKFSLGTYALPIFAVGFPLLFSKRNKIKHWGEFVVGFALLFFGLSLLKDAVPEFSKEQLEFLGQYADGGLLSRIFFVFVGAVVTIIVQSSSAAMALTLVLTSTGVLPLEIATAMILGENIGTTITAELASIVGNVHAKRSARIHSMFNIVGVTWMVLLMPYFVDLTAHVLHHRLGWIDINPMLFPSEVDPGRVQELNEAKSTTLAAFHTVFNAVNVLLLIWFVPFLVKLATSTVRSKGEHDNEYRLEYLSSGISNTSELAIVEAKKEILIFGNVIEKLNKNFRTAVNSLDKKEIQQAIDKVYKLETRTDKMEMEIASYLTKVSETEVSDATSGNIRIMLNAVTELERIGDRFFEMTKTVEKKVEEKIWFNQVQRDGVNQLLDLLDMAIEEMKKNIDGTWPDINLERALQLEENINNLRDDIKVNHFKHLEKGKYPLQSGLVYNNLFTNLEKIGDHIMGVNEALTGKNLQ